eukprot:8897286-Pyramimonas_sp.AAC.1
MTPDHTPLRRMSHEWPEVARHLDGAPEEPSLARLAGAISCQLALVLSARHHGAAVEKIVVPPGGRVLSPLLRSVPVT